MAESRRYRAYLLRCWQEGEAAPGKEPHYRFSVEEILRKRPRRGFDSLEALVAFLRAELSSGRGETPEGKGPTREDTLQDSVRALSNKRGGDNER
ncbi:MAG: hypothetical protein IMY86_12615 [Chloroflexi bacterium]|nr:hypothetical protein [Chloroflexota bacterium]